MALLLSEADVRALLTMPLALEAVEQALRRLGNGEAILHARRRLELPEKSFLHYMAAADAVGGYMGMKIYTSVRGALRFLVPLYRAATGELLALVEAETLGQMRTGAATGIATKYLARPDARVVGIVGTGFQARAQLAGIVAVRSIERVRAFGRDARRRELFCAEMTAQLGLPVLPASSAEDAVRGADIVVTATTASQPVVLGAWLSPGTHINAIGANSPRKRELDDEVIRRSALIVADSIEQSRLESGDLLDALGGDAAHWSRVRELAAIVAGKIPGRTGPGEITLFKSNGIAIWDVAVAARVYELALDRGLGHHVPLWERVG